MDSTKFVLFTADNKYVVEYLLQQLILSDSITEALIFEEYDLAVGFRKMLAKNCKLDCSINTYIE
ncbi:MAG: hypothetical protein ABJD66_00050 [Cellulophaga sp.]|uniref:hypothetical protein n=1 Tax=unclassified Cellulophaga TaxID=2634405 RepID=UPI000C2CCCA4|nr:MULTISPECIES: hypothetical protein [unclassified Cellulophaga]MDO6490980.1 hypothetical protein [Cellulophaga sp. 2_MG-2023]MDO6493826.1 hypothetical protein [Cellulophaga sp. 3_MG-2023]PKB44159.1 hypothetical protein AX016_2373 [Cellulophaga sp. RHA19]